MACPGRLTGTLRQPSARQRIRRHAPVSKTIDAPRPVLAAAAAAVSGLAALVYEVAWTRLLALVVGPTTYAFAIMAASFITGIAVGSTLGVRLARRSARVPLWLAAMLLATAISSVLAAWFTASHLPFIVARETAAATAFEPLLLREALAMMILLMPASISLGATFTLALAAASPAIETVARDTARIYAANTIGAVAGALIAGFFLVPRFGLQDTFVLTSRMLLVAGSVIAAIAATRPGKQRPTRLAGGVVLAGSVVAIVTFAAPEWDRDLISSGAYKYSRQIRAEDLDWSLRAGHLEYYKEGAAGTVSVRRLGGTRSLAIDGKVDASNAGDMLTQRLLGLLPTLLHPEPRDALVIGLGSGVTADAILASGEVQRLDVVEISPEVVEASAYFERENRGVLQESRACDYSSAMAARTCACPTANTMSSSPSRPIPGWPASPRCSQASSSRPPAHDCDPAACSASGLTRTRSPSGISDRSYTPSHQFSLTGRCGLSAKATCS